MEMHLDYCTSLLMENVNFKLPSLVGDTDGRTMQIINTLKVVAGIVLLIIVLIIVIHSAVVLFRNGNIFFFCFFFCIVNLSGYQCHKLYLCPKCHLDCTAGITAAVLC